MFEGRELLLLLLLLPHVLEQFATVREGLYNERKMREAQCTGCHYMFG